MPHSSTKGLTRELIATYTAVGLATFVATRLIPKGWLMGFGSALLSFFFLWITIMRVRQDPRGLAHYGIRFGGLLLGPADPAPTLLKRALIEVLWAAAVMVVVFPPYFLVYAAWFDLPLDRFVFTPPPDALNFAMTHWLVVAIPEEALFRGYVQTRLLDRFPAPGSLAVSFTALCIQAALFAGIHIFRDLNPMSLVVFFPGLFFGLLRAWRGNVAVAALFHAASNWVGHVLAHGW